MKKFLIGVIATMFFACAGNSDSSKQIADNSQEKAVEELQGKTTNEPLKKDSVELLEKLADDALYLSILCERRVNEACEEERALSQKVGEEKYDEVRTLAAEKFFMFMKKMEALEARRKENDKTVGEMLPPILPSDCGECSDSLKKFVEDRNDSTCGKKQLLENPSIESECLKRSRQMMERYEKMSLEDKKMLEKIRFKKIMELE